MPADPVLVADRFARLEAEAREILAGEGFEGAAVRVDRTVRMKYTTQLHTIEVPVPDTVDAAAVEALIGEFGRLYDEVHGEDSGHREGGVNLTGFIVRARGLVERPELARAHAAEQVERLSRQVYWIEEGGWVETPVIRMAGGRLDETLTGPVLVELPDTVVVIRPGQSAAWDDFGNLVISL